MIKQTFLVKLEWDGEPASATSDMNHWLAEHFGPALKSVVEVVETGGEA